MAHPSEFATLLFFLNQRSIHLQQFPTGLILNSKMTCDTVYRLVHQAAKNALEPQNVQVPDAHTSIAISAAKETFKNRFMFGNVSGPMEPHFGVLIQPVSYLIEDYMKTEALSALFVQMDIDDRGWEEQRNDPELASTFITLSSTETNSAASWNEVDIGRNRIDSVFPEEIPDPFKAKWDKM
ncbi:hypothetical protein BT96DRAFT_1024121 [Gymnopus androsaceus JB14]|uniref:Uncharacterized protein n=1 Tax=Gymnopus androsaceus JB14 TaxID=1447944 RepID=A0A6A4GZE1_9AGAR|nr:hypothetical protein BT96DRAFT_1024121 [Gymnopus androsaceus JB14]